MKSTTAIPSFYFVLIAFLAIQAVLTVYHGGLTFANTARLSQISYQEQQVDTQIQTLQQTIASQHSIVNIQTSALYNQFQPIANVLTVTQSQAVASR